MRHGPRHRMGLLTGCVLTLVTIDLSANAVAQDNDKNAPENADASIERYRALLSALESQRLNPAMDGFAEVDAKLHAARVAIGQFTEPLVAEVVSREVVSFMAQDIVMYRNTVSPRLTGRVVRVGPGQPLADLNAAAGTLRPGDVVKIGPGTYQLPETRAVPIGWNDIALIGSGPEATTLTIGRRGEIEAAHRLRIESMRIECGDDPMCDIRNGGSLHLRGCLIAGYNSGAGGSSSINGSDSIMLVEQCTFEGLSGRAARPGTNGGTAFDLRGQNWLYVRQSQFIDNRVIGSATFPCTFDGCRAMGGDQRSGPVVVFAHAVVQLRDSSDLVDRVQNTTAFSKTTDDVEVIRYAKGDAVEADQRTRDLVAKLQLARRLPYWIGLMRHEDAEVRTIAAERMTALCGVESLPLSVDDAAGNESADQVSPEMKAELDFARFILWYEKNKDALRWSDADGRYVLQPN